ncbi:MAG: phosphatase PAP2 family protein [Actinobacteria bacterium]|nr:phosphatase PAP2 family protein [Actinomycetota bacterium]
MRAVLAQPPQTPKRVSPRAIVMGGLFLLYVALTVLVLVPHSFVLDFDRYLLDLRLSERYPQWHTFIFDYVMLGQRGPATLVFLPFFLVVAWRQRSTRPLVLLATGLLWLNLSVGLVKYAIGRVGPAAQSNVHDLFVWGNSIYPSGHVSNAVVLYGLVAWVAPRYRRVFIGGAVFISVTIGLGTIYLRTHWFSDVVGGWIGGGLVLLTLPYVVPYAQRATDLTIRTVHGWWVRWRTPPVPAPSSSVTPSRPAVQKGNATPVRSVARNHRAVARASSRAALEERTRRG